VCHCLSPPEYGYLFSRYTVEDDSSSYINKLANCLTPATQMVSVWGVHAAFSGYSRAVFTCIRIWGLPLAS
jgi:hypothetical protein